MPRPPRIDYKGAFHHVMNRGQDRRSIFKDDNVFGLTHHGSVSGVLTKIRHEVKKGDWLDELKDIEGALFII